MDSIPTAAEMPSPKVRSLRAVHNWSYVVVLILCGVFVAESSCFIRTQSLTYDEPVHIAAGQDAWRNHRFQMWNDHPPLARLWCALPLLNPKWQIHVYGLPDGFRADQVNPDPQALAWRARAMNVLLGLALGLLLWKTGREMFSAGAATLALALFVISPAVIAHFSLATTDGVATLFIFVTAVFLLRWRARPSLVNTACFGVLLGLLLLSKFSTPVMFGMALLWMLVLSPRGIVVKPWHWNWGKALIALLIALMTVWAGYFFHTSRLTLRNHELTTTFPNRPPVVYQGVKSNHEFSVPVPAGEYLEGLRNLIRHNRFGQISFFLGRVSRRGFKTYFPVVIFFKWPIVVLAIFATAAILANRKLIRLPSGWWVTMSFPIVYFAFAIFSRFDIGDRHVLPIYPFMLLVAGGLWEFAKTHRVLARVVIVALFLQAADTLRYAPDYLSYFNPYVPPTVSYKLLTDSNLDWGQGLLALQKYQRAHSNQQISLAYFGSVDPRVYGIQANALREDQRVTGTVIISASNLSGQFLENSTAYHWVLQYPLRRVLNHSLYVFEVPAIRR
jgi:4-amino-4-deoxy-L-arabinose transferase-like glycosyltransferase